MKNIKIKKMKLVNFKGIRDLELKFSEITNIGGKNGTGKTTIFDAFVWLLFGKNSKDQKQFDIKTIDEEGHVIPKLPHEVIAIMEVDGEEIELCRRYSEKWTKKRNSVEEIFSGHEEERLYNNVPLSVKDWDANIEAICEERVFKFITRPLFFNSQKMEEKRNFLFSMIKPINDEILADDSEFDNLFEVLKKKDINEYKQEIKAKKKRILNEIETIPARIEEINKNISELSEEDFVALDDEITKLKKERSEIEKNVADKANAIAEKKKKQMARISQLSADLLKRESELQSEAGKKWLAENKEREDVKFDLSIAEKKIESLKKNIELNQKKVEKLDSERGILISEYRKIKSETLNFDEKDFICPTCRRPFDADQVEEKQEQMRANFNERIATLLEENKKKGLSVKEQKEKCIDEIEDDKQHLKQEESWRDNRKEKLAQLGVPTERMCSDELCAQDEVCKKINEEIEGLRKETSSEIYTDNTQTLKNLNDKIEELSKRLEKRSLIERHLKRISELEQSLKSGNSELTELELIEKSIKDFTRKKILMTEESINKLFSFVKFKMFDTQVNGEEVETCEATVKGVPWESLNSAMKINAGLDCINAICNHFNVCAPIFVDNAEGVNEIIKTEGQQVRLHVTKKDDKLTIN
jgi:chromosome segregation ATPase